MSGLNYFYIFFTVSLCFFDLAVAVTAINKKTKMGTYLSVACVFASATSFAYLFSTLASNYLANSVLYSLYNIGIDFMLLFLFYFCILYTRQNTYLEKRFHFILDVCILFDMIIELVNPWTEVAFSFVQRNSDIARYSIQFKTLYVYHLVFIYLLIGFTLYILFRKQVKVAREYKPQYFTLIIVILATTVINAVCQYMPKNNPFLFVDYSVWCLTIAAMGIYQAAFIVPKTIMKREFHGLIFTQIDQGIVLFDYNNELVVVNKKAKEFFKNKIELEDGLLIKDFISSLDIKNQDFILNDNYSFQFFFDDGASLIPLRCDYRHLTNNKHETKGYMFVVSNMQFETDLLTNFHLWDSFSKFINNNPDLFSEGTVVSLCDISNLKDINNENGRDAGDITIKDLSDLMRRHFNQDTYFVRGKEAFLYAIDYNCGPEFAKDAFEKIKDEFNKNIIYTVATVGKDGKNINSTLQNAEETIYIRRMMDKEANHSSVLTSLVKALQECDSDTEAHVQRTLEVSRRFAKEIGLSDFQSSQLELLSILHDIGKIGIPLDILNKPNKLTNEEWLILKTHSEKGYQIANSSRELSSIAPYILHHHERWDGKGYPSGLRGEDIPLLSRIIAIIDSFDAMISERPYKDSMSKISAIKELRRCAGTQFDPALVEIYIAMIESNDDYFDIKPAKILKKQEKKNDSLDAIGDVIPITYTRYVLDKESRILFIDDNFTAITGYTKNDVERLSLSQNDLLPEDDRVFYNCMVQEQVAKKEMAYFEHKLKRKDGIYIRVLCFGRQYYDSATRSIRTEIIVCAK